MRVLLLCRASPTSHVSLATLTRAPTSFFIFPGLSVA